MLLHQILEACVVCAELAVDWVKGSRVSPMERGTPNRTAQFLKLSVKPPSEGPSRWLASWATVEAAIKHCMLTACFALVLRHPDRRRTVLR